MRMGLTMALTVAVMVFFSKVMEDKLEKDSEKYRDHTFEDGEFAYANWARIFEITGLFVITLISTAYYLFIDPEEINGPFVLGITIFLILLIVYRITVWKHEKVQLVGNLLVARKRRRRGTIVVNLDDVRAVEVHYFRFLLHMEDGTKVKFPSGYKRQSYIYGAMKYYRSNLPEANHHL